MSVLSLLALLLSFFAPPEHASTKFFNKQMSPAPPPASAPKLPSDQQDGGSVIDPIG